MAAIMIRDTNSAMLSNTLSNLAYIEQYAAAAAYVPENNGGNPHATNYVVYCSTRTCPCASRDGRHCLQILPVANAALPLSVNDDSRAEIFALASQGT